MYRLMTAELAEALKGFPLYSQDTKAKRPFTVPSLHLAPFVGTFLKAKPRATISYSLVSSSECRRMSMVMYRSMNFRA